MVDHGEGEPNEPGFRWTQFKELIKNCFYPISVQKAKEKKFLELD